MEILSLLARSFDEAAKNEYIPCSLIDMLEAVSAQLNTTVPPSNDDQNIHEILSMTCLIQHFCRVLCETMKRIRTYQDLQ